MTANEEQAKSLFLAALELAPEQWPALLDEGCRGNAELRARVEQLLYAHQAMGKIGGHKPEDQPDGTPQHHVQGNRAQTVQHPRHGIDEPAAEPGRASPTEEGAQHDAEGQRPQPGRLIRRAAQRFAGHQIGNLIPDNRAEDQANGPDETNHR